MEATDQPILIPFPTRDQRDPVVITGIGLIGSTGSNREALWDAVRAGKSGVKRMYGLLGVPDGLVLGAPVEDFPEPIPQLKVVNLALAAAAEAWEDAGLTPDQINPHRSGTAISAHMGDTGEITHRLGKTEFENERNLPHGIPWFRQWFPNTACIQVSQQYELLGPRVCHSTACASSLVDVLSAVRMIEDGQADLMLAGGAEAIHPLFAAGFHQMRVLADDPEPSRACRPFDRTRRGFVMGEGAGILVLERMSHALNRGARIYAEIPGGRMLGEAKHVTGLDSESDGIERLILDTLRRAKVAPDEVGYISAHGTGTLQNDKAEAAGIRRAFGSAANTVRISSLKAMLGHLVNASGVVELGLTALALRDGFLPPTINLTDPDPDCQNLDCLPREGRLYRAEIALKLAVAFGGHLVSVLLKRWPAENHGFGYPLRRAA